MQIEINVKDGSLGDWSITTFTINEEQADVYNMRMLMERLPEALILPGTYKKLTHKEMGVVMSNTPMEIRDHRKLFLNVKLLGGDILINGLGLGMALTKILTYENVTSVTVIEKSEEVIQLVSESFKDKRVSIIHADAMTYKPPVNKKYSVVWHDIWNEKSADNLKEMGTLHRRYGRKCIWQGSWGKDWIKKDQRRN